MRHFGRSPVFLLIMLLCILVEWLWRESTARGYDLRGAGTSILVGIGNAIAGTLGAVAIGGVFAFTSELAPVHWPMRDWRVWLVGFVAVEFVYYVHHRASHHVRWMWATHAVHHTPEQMTFLSALRLGWTNVLSLGWLLYLPLILAGFPPLMVIALLAFDLHFQFFLHTEAVGRLGPLEWVFNTPAHHRVHHGSNAAYLDCNFGGALIVFDRLFGTLRIEQPHEPVCYGLARPLGTLDPLKLVFGEWYRLLKDLRAAPGWIEAIRIAVGRP